MKAIGKVLLFVFEVVSYLALAVLILSILGMIGLHVFDFCQGGADRPVCESPIAKDLASVFWSVLLITVFTGFPALFAIAGLIFLVRRVFLKHDPATNNDKIEPSEKSGRRDLAGLGRLVLKVFLGVMALALLFGVISGFVGS